MYIVRAIGSRLQTVVIVGLKEDGNKKNVAGFGLGGIGDSYEVGYLKLIIEACRIVQAFCVNFICRWSPYFLWHNLGN